jgi:hypothetical protein
MMAPEQIAQWVLEQSVRGATWSREDVDMLMDDPALFRILAEGLSDRFESALVDRYVEIFSYVLSRKLPNMAVETLRARYEKIRQPREFAGNADSVRDIYVLSRVTLGADVAITSVILDGLKRRFRQSRIWLCGDRKSYQLFENDNRIGYYPLFYERGAGLDRVLGDRAFFKSGLVVDPDSRISQLGLLPVCPDENYYFFESRRAGGDDSLETLTQLATRWVRATFGMESKPYVAPKSTRWGSRYVAVSLGTGGNASKGLSAAFERMLIQRLAQSELPVVVDLGAGGEETERVQEAVRGLTNVNTHKGTFAEFAGVISQASRYCGYDSAGTHVAAAAGVPLTVFFKGHVNERMFERWKPSPGANAKVVRIDDPHPDPSRVLAALS